MSQESKRKHRIPLHDLHPKPADMLAEVLTGLASNPKTLPCKYFYDERGSLLFDQICELDEYYPTRTETMILREYGRAIAERVGPSALVIELGNGNSRKTRLLLHALDSPSEYVPIDISKEHLRSSAADISDLFPELSLWPICADFTQKITLPPQVQSQGEPLIFFPGSTIGNFDPAQRALLLSQLRTLTHPNGGFLLVGIDILKDRKILEAAYNDQRGVTAQFNLNLLRRINNDLKANFVLNQFEHFAILDESHGRIEMHLRSTSDQEIILGERHFSLRRGETICTEHSYKFEPERFVETAAQCGWQLENEFTDAHGLFSLLLLRASDLEPGWLAN